MKLFRSSAFKVSLCLTFIMGAGLVYYFHHLNLLTVSNESQFPLQSITVKAADQVIWQGDIEANEKLRVRFTVEEDSHLQIVGQWQGKRISSDPLGRVEKGMGRKLDIIFSEAGQFRYFDVF